MPKWVNVAKADDLETTGISVEVEGNSIFIVKANNKYYAVQNRCSHEDFPLEDGDIEDEAIICPVHGAKFCLNTGNVLECPATENVTVYPVRLMNDNIEVEVG